MSSICSTIYSVRTVTCTKRSVKNVGQGYRACVGMEGGDRLNDITTYILYITVWGAVHTVLYGFLALCPRQTNQKRAHGMSGNSASLYNKQQNWILCTSNLYGVCICCNNVQCRATGVSTAAGAFCKDRIRIANYKSDNTIHRSNNSSIFFLSTLPAAHLGRK